MGIKIRTIEKNEYPSFTATADYIAGICFSNGLVLLAETENGIAASVQAVARHFGISQLYDFYPEYDKSGHEPVLLDLKGKKQGEVAAVFQYNYPIFTDDFRFRMEPDNFERMRSDYQYRREIYVE